MEDIVKEDIKQVLKKVLTALQQNIPEELSELSNHTIHDASIFQDEDSILFAISIYALYKTILRCKEAECTYNQFLEPIEQAYKALLVNDILRYRDYIQKVISEIKKSDKKISQYIEEVIDKARIKKGSKIHEHGISIARTAEMIGISQWELANYIGKTSIGESVGKTINERIAFARKLFS